MIGFFESLPGELQVLLITAITSIVTAVVSCIVSFIKCRSKKVELQQAQQEFELVKIRMETEKLTLENQLITGTYTICPNCGSKLLLTDLIFKNDTKKEVK